MTRAVGFAPSEPCWKLYNVVNIQLPPILDSLNPTPQPLPLQYCVPPALAVPYKFPARSIVNPAAGILPSAPPVNECTTENVCACSWSGRRIIRNATAEAATIILQPSAKLRIRCLSELTIRFSSQTKMPRVVRARRPNATPGGGARFCLRSSALSTTIGGLGGGWTPTDSASGSRPSFGRQPGLAATRSGLFLAFDLRDPRLHQFLNQCNRQWLVCGEVDGPFRCGEALQFVLKGFHDRGRGEQAAVVGKRRKPQQYSLVLERRNPIADGLGGLGRQSRPNRRAQFVQSAAGGFRDASKVFLNVFRSGVALRRRTAFAGFRFLHASHATRTATFKSMSEASGRPDMEP